MIVVLVAAYIAILALFIWLKFIPFNLFWKLSPLIVLLLLNIGLFIPMGWGAPQGPALVNRYAVAITPEVTGEVLDVPVEPNVPLKAGEVLFRIDPAPYQAQLDALHAQLKFQELRLSQMASLQKTGTGRAFDVESRQAEVDELKGKVEGAQWNLDKTVVRAPADGYVTNLALRKGARAATTPVMTFVDTSETLLGVEIPQIYSRYVQPGQDVEIAFKFAPGTIYTGKVETVLQAIASGLTQVSGTAVAPTQIESVPLVVRVKLDDEEFANRLPAGATGTAAIFTDHLKVTHVIRRVMLRMIGILNYINPF
jgi:RND family efflux transporter MFP subunit